MSDLIFIKDVIYGLKQEYGELLEIRKENRFINTDTGASTTNYEKFDIPLAVPLPLNLRAAFMKTVGINRMAYLEPGQREILIDKDDIPIGMLIEIHDRAVFTSGRIAEIVKIDDYEFAMILIIKS
jgi:hypothetical protein